LWLSVERGQQLIEEVGRHDGDNVVPAYDLVGTTFSGRTHGVARGLVRQNRSVLDPPLGLRPGPKLKSM